MAKREKLNSQNNSKPKDYPKKERNYIKTNNTYNIDDSNFKDIKDTSSKLIFNKIKNNEIKAKNLQNRNNYLKIEENNKNSKRINKLARNSYIAGYKSNFCSYKDTIPDYNMRLLKTAENNGDISRDVYTHSRFISLYGDKKQRNFLASKNPNNLSHKICSYNSKLNGNNSRTLNNTKDVYCHFNN